MTYVRERGQYRYTNEFGTFYGSTLENAKLAALMAENDARHRQEVADRQREIARESQAKELAFTDARYGA